MNEIDIARTYAIHCHNSTNHTYDCFAYSVHLQMVVDVAQKFIHLIPEKDKNTVVAACWVHDTIEDCRVTYNDLKNSLNEQIAEIAYALTNEKGKNRAERANEKYYEGIRNTPYAVFVKLCDRIANYEYSKKSGSRMTEIYEKEMDDFITNLIVKDFGDSTFEIESLISKGIVELKFYETTPEHAKEYGIEAKSPLYVQNLCVSENERLKGIGKKVLNYLEDYARKNGNDVIFGYVASKASFTKDSRQSFFCDVDMIKNWLHNNAYAINGDNNIFHKVVKLADSENKSQIIAHHPLKEMLDYLNEITKRNDN